MDVTYSFVQCRKRGWLFVVLVLFLFPAKRAVRVGGFSGSSGGGDVAFRWLVRM